MIRARLAFNWFWFMMWDWWFDSTRMVIWCCRIPCSWGWWCGTQWGWRHRRYFSRHAGVYWGGARGVRASPLTFSTTTHGLLHETMNLEPVWSTSISWTWFWHSNHQTFSESASFTSGTILLIYDASVIIFAFRNNALVVTGSSKKRFTTFTSERSKVESSCWFFANSTHLILHRIQTVQLKEGRRKNVLGRLLLVGYLLVRKIRVLISIFGIGITALGIMYTYKKTAWTASILHVPVEVATRIWLTSYVFAAILQFLDCRVNKCMTWLRISGSLIW